MREHIFKAKTKSRDNVVGYYVKAEKLDGSGFEHFIIEDLKEGKLTTAEIARKHGIKWQSVHKLRRKLEADGEL